ncbi:hypothetical protein GCM10023116_18830 [Kistimonas scapharcae]|uniref:Uncharacterized protein n=1 Tax=Kistimonas scapharcae TaxID=1036133 RepID=A0ABP8V069_9GAMM
MTIGGAVIPNVLFTEHNAEAIRSKRLEQIKSLELESNKLEQQILKDKKFLQGNEAEQARERKEIENEIREVQAEITAVYGLDENKISLQTSSEQVEQLTQTTNDLSTKITHLNEAITTHKNLHTKTKGEADESRLANSTLETTLVTLNRNWQNLTNGMFEHTAVPMQSTSSDASAINEALNPA